MSRTAAVVLNYRAPRDAVLAVRSLESARPSLDQIVIVDNHSGDGSEALLRKHFPAHRVLQTGANLGFSGGCNVGIRAALEDGAEAVFLLNDDAMVTSETLRRMSEALAEDGAAGIAGPVVLQRFDPTLVATAGMAFSIRSGRMHHLDLGRVYDHPHRPYPRRRVPAVSGCAMLITRQVLECLDLLDEDYFFSFEDVDLCLRAARLGHPTLLVGDAVAYHQGARSMAPDSPSRLYYATRNHLLAARRGAPRGPLAALPRSATILALNLAHALLTAGIPVSQGLPAVWRGWRDYRRRRFGAAVAEGRSF